jgi:hypothetical protein
MANGTGVGRSSSRHVYEVRRDLGEVLVIWDMQNRRSPATIRGTTRPARSLTLLLSPFGDSTYRGASLYRSAHIAVVHSSFVTPPFGLTDPQFFDARADGSELFLNRSLECLRLLA